MEIKGNVDVTIKVENDNMSMSAPFGLPSIVLSLDDPMTRSMIDDMKKQFNQEVTQVTVRAKMVLNG